MRSRLLLPLLAALALLAGCAAKPQLPVPLEPFAGNTRHKVGVALAKVPKASLELPGASCLLCIAAAQVANAQLARHVDTLDTGELKPVRDSIAAALRKKGVDAIVVSEAIEVDKLGESTGTAPQAARRNFMPLKAKYGIDKLVIVNVEGLGILRNYSAYIPNGDPRVFVRMSGAMVDLSTNTYQWYLPVYILQGAEGGRWDEPPRYPGLTNAFYQALEQSKDRLLQPWSE